MQGNGQLEKRVVEGEAFVWWQTGPNGVSTTRLLRNKTCASTIAEQLYLLHLRESESLLKVNDLGPLVVAVNIRNLEVRWVGGHRENTERVGLEMSAMPRIKLTCPRPPFQPCTAMTVSSGLMMESLRASLRPNLQS